MALRLLAPAAALFYASAQPAACASSPPEQWTEDLGDDLHLLQYSAMPRHKQPQADAPTEADAPDAVEAEGFITHRAKKEPEHRRGIRKGLVGPLKQAANSGDVPPSQAEASNWPDTKDQQLAKLQRLWALPEVPSQAPDSGDVPPSQGEASKWPESKDQLQQLLSAGLGHEEVDATAAETGQAHSLPKLVLSQESVETVSAPEAGHPEAVRKPQWSSLQQTVRVLPGGLGAGRPHWASLQEAVVTHPGGPIAGEMPVPHADA